MSVNLVGGIQHPRASFLQREHAKQSKSRIHGQGLGGYRKRALQSWEGGLHGFQFGRLELPNFQNLATTTK